MNPILAQIAAGQPLYRPFMILTLTTLAVIAAAVWFLWHRQASGTLSLIDTFRELIRAIVIAEFGAAFVILALESKIDAGIVANTVGIIIAFLFGQRTGSTPGAPPT